VVYDLEDLHVRYTVYAICGAIWFAQLARWLYYVLTYNYRLTTRRLFIERSFLNTPRAELELRRISGVVVETSGLDRRLGVGTLRVLGDDRAPRLVLLGVRDPGRLAAEIRHLAKQAREQGALTLPVPPAPPEAGHVEGEV
jgi:hypothetical protein